jgi:hypothetical protein
VVPAFAATVLISIRVGAAVAAAKLRVPGTRWPTEALALVAVALIASGRAFNALAADTAEAGTVAADLAA